MAAMTRIFSRIFLKIDAALKNKYLHLVCWKQSESKKRSSRYQGHKVLIWWKKIQMAAMTRIFFRSFWKIDAG